MSSAVALSPAASAAVPKATPFRIPSLDGMRAASLLLVLTTHASGTRGFVNWGPLRMLAHLGVHAFFTISGFLITTLLCRELEKTRTISLQKFYLRRFRRIAPPAMVLLVTIAALTAAGVLDVPWKHFLAAATYTSNFKGDLHWNVAHTWSLSCEEQFYLLWPPVLKYFGRQTGARVCVGAIVLAPLLRVLVYRTGHLDQWGLSFPLHVDALAFGCLLALEGHRLLASERWRRFLCSHTFYLVPAAAVAGWALYRYPDLYSVIGQPLMFLSITLCIQRWTNFPDGRAGWLLNLRPVAWFGMMTYSLYLWQQLFLDRRSDRWYNTFPLSAALMFIPALLSYYYVELPFVQGKVLRLPDERRTP
ncbi:MAG: acyltransferase [Deltaproteobacteria bacterium]|nr:acyltransferase [Deltaproteobacteria bacterium]